MKTLTQYIIESIDKPAKIFIIIKPGFFKYSKDILDRFRKDGWNPLKTVTKRLTPDEAKQLYVIHKKEDWYEDLWKYMSSAPTTAFILINNDMNMSPDIFDKVSKIKDELRDKWGESDMKNVLHSSDSIQHMKDESSIYFNEQ